MIQTAKRGITLLELLIVISIIVLIVTIGVVSVARFRKQGRDARRIADVQTVIKAMQSAETAGSSLASGAGTCVGTGGPYALRNCAFRPASPEVQFDFSRLADPLPSATAACTAASAAPCAYSIRGASAGVAPTVSDYRIYFFLETGANGMAQGVHVATAAGVD